MTTQTTVVHSDPQEWTYSGAAQDEMHTLCYDLSESAMSWISIPSGSLDLVLSNTERLTEVAINLSIKSFAIALFDGMELKDNSRCVIRLSCYPVGKVTVFDPPKSRRGQVRMYNVTYTVNRQLSHSAVSNSEPLPTTSLYSTNVSPGPMLTHHGQLADMGSSSASLPAVADHQPSCQCSTVIIVGGIACGVIVILIAIILALVYLLRKRRRALSPAVDRNGIRPFPFQEEVRPYTLCPAAPSTVSTDRGAPSSTPSVSPRNEKIARLRVLCERSSG